MRASGSGGRRRWLIAVVATVAGAALPQAAAAGPISLTGHPLDHACAAVPLTPDPQHDPACRAFRVLVARARAAAQDPSKPLLVFDLGARDVANALVRAYAPAAPPSSQILDPTAPSTAQTPITPAAYSGVLVASDASCGGCALNAGDAGPLRPRDSDAIAALAPKIRGYLAAGGGVIFLSGGIHGDGTPATGPDSYYDLFGLPDGRPYGGGPTRVTPAGLALGFPASLDGCCAAQNSFAEPVAGSPLRVLERDAAGRPVSLAGDGVTFGGKLVADPVDLPAGGTDTPGEPVTGASTSPGAAARSCASRRNFAIHVRRLRGARYARVRIQIPRRPDVVLRGGAITGRVDLRGLPRGRWAVRITVTTTTGATFSGYRRYRTCGKIPRPGSRYPL